MDDFKFIKPEKDLHKRLKEKKYSLREVEEPYLYRDIFPYSEVPRAVFDGISLPLSPPEDFWITCTTFRDGQQARPPYTVKQMIDLFTYLHRLGGPKGIIRQCEFFLYSDKDKEAARECLKKGFSYPEITGWIRAKPQDFKLVKDMGLKETGILTSISDYHVFLKLKLNRTKAKDKYLSLVKTALENGVLPRCHFEDITRADIYGFVIPFAQELMEVSKDAKVPIKIRLCDTMGYGLPFSEAALPRGIPKLVQAMVKEAGVPSEWLEWHGHNDFHKALINGVCAWLYGCSALNGTLLGFGERCGNPPIEGACIEYVSLYGSANGMDLTVITEIANYYKKEIKAPVPQNYPFVGDNFNVTRAGIHADGMIKNEEIYNIFDTKKILNRPIGITITDKSGLAGISLWINNYLGLEGEKALSKSHPGIAGIDKWVREQYASGRTTGISPEEMIIQAQVYLPEHFKSDFDKLKEKAQRLSYDLIKQVVKHKAVVSMDTHQQEEYLQQVLKDNSFIQLIYATNTEGKKITKNITQEADRDKYEHTCLGESFSDREWFKVPLKEDRVHITDFYKSKVTGLLCITVSSPIKNKDGRMVGILGFDIKFEDLVRREAK